VTTTGNVVGGFGLDVDYGGPCSAGYVRSDKQVIVTDTRGRAYAEDRGWADPDNSRDCRIRVHYSIDANWPSTDRNYVTVTIFIREKGE
jgi:hypothetical protein